MGRAVVIYLEDTEGVFSCRRCNTHLTTRGADLTSSDYRGQHGSATLFATAVNYNVGVEENRHMTTGQYIVRDVFCLRCNTTLGWKYVKAFDTEQQFKEGKLILEDVRKAPHKRWESSSTDTMQALLGEVKPASIF